MSELLRAIVPAEMMNMDGFFQALDAGGDDLSAGVRQSFLHVVT